MSWTDVKGNESNKVGFLSLPEGITKIRILDQSPYSRWVHWIPSAKTSVSCIGMGCPICEIIKEQKEAKMQPTYSSNKRHAMNVLNRTTGEVEILEQGKTFFEDLLEIMEEKGDLTKFDIKVKRKGTGLDTKYRLDPEEPEELSGEDLKKLDNMVNLEEYFIKITKEQMIEVINGKSLGDVLSSNKKEEEIELE